MNYLFLFRAGEITSLAHNTHGSNLDYFTSCPKNAIELVDLLKSISRESYDVYVRIWEQQMEIFINSHDAIDQVHKIQLSSMPVTLSINERFFDFLSSFETVHDQIMHP